MKQNPLLDGLEQAGYAFLFKADKRKRHKIKKQVRARIALLSRELKRTKNKKEKTMIEYALREWKDLYDAIRRYR